MIEKNPVAQHGEDQVLQQCSISRIQFMFARKTGDDVRSEGFTVAPFNKRIESELSCGLIHLHSMKHGAAAANDLAWGKRCGHSCQQ